MAAIETIPVPLYQPLDPYQHLVDNKPIQGLIDRVFAVNDQSNNNTLILLQSIGTQGTLANRLNQSIDQDGSLKTAAIDDALHSIAEHLDGAGFVRMTDDERAKLSQITPNATATSVVVETTNAGDVDLTDQELRLKASSSITWYYDGVGVQPVTDFPSTVRHVHYYGLAPAHQNLFSPDYQNYQTTTIGTAYMEGSLRVYVNGVRLNQSADTRVPTEYAPLTFSQFSYSEDTATGGVVTSGKFSLSQPIPSSAVIIIDFDVLYS